MYSEDVLLFEKPHVFLPVLSLFETSLPQSIDDVQHGQADQTFMFMYIDCSIHFSTFLGTPFFAFLPESKHHQAPKASQCLSVSSAISDTSPGIYAGDRSEILWLGRRQTGTLHVARRDGPPLGGLRRLQSDHRTSETPGSEGMTQVAECLDS